MKGNIKKLAVFVVIATITTFISATMASAADHKKKAFHGEYAATSVGMCLGTSPMIPDVVFTNSLTQQSIYTFNSDGTGTVEGTHFGITFPPNQSTALRDMSWEFTYEVTQDGTITFVGEGIWKFPGTDDIAYTSSAFSESGKLSGDRKTITLGPVTPEATVLTFPSGFVFEVTCNISRVLIRVGE